MLEPFLRFGSKEVLAVAGAVTRHRRDQSMHVLVNVGYESKTLDRMDDAFQEVSPSKAMERYVSVVDRAPIFWDDFTSPEPTPEPVAQVLQTLRRKGYRQGVSTRMLGQSLSDVTVLHLSFLAPSLDTAHRQRVWLLARMMRPAVRQATIREAAPLSQRQIQVLSAAARGLTNKEIARELVLAPRTIATHFENMFDRLGTTSRAQTVAWALEHGLL